MLNKEYVSRIFFPNTVKEKLKILATTLKVAFEAYFDDWRNSVCALQDKNIIFFHLNLRFLATTKLLIGNILCCHDSMSRG